MKITIEKCAMHITFEYWDDDIYSPDRVSDIAFQMAHTLDNVKHLSKSPLEYTLDKVSEEIGNMNDYWTKEELITETCKDGDECDFNLCCGCCDYCTNANKDDMETFSEPVAEIIEEVSDRLIKTHSRNPKKLKK